MINLIDIRAYCGFYNDLHDWTKNPFNFNGYTVATDSHILIAVEGEFEEPATDIPQRSIEKLIDDALAADYRPPEKLDLPLGVACHCCEGTGKNKPYKCRKCNGHGCDSCDDGWLPNITVDFPCPDCHGTGRTTAANSPERYYLDEFTYPYSVNYLRLIKKLDAGGLQLAETEAPPENLDPRHGILFFKSPGCVGALAGMKP